MTWYFCNHPSHNRPLFFQGQIAPTCSGNHPTTLAHDHIIHNFGAGQGAYTIRYHVDRDDIKIKMVTTVNNRTYNILLNLAYDLPHNRITQDTEVPVPGGGRWTSNMHNYAGGNPGGGQRPPFPAQFNGALKMRLGSHTGAGQGSGLVHLAHRHAAMFGNMIQVPANNDVITLDGLKDNFRNMTSAPDQQANGIKKIARQRDNQRFAVHGVSSTQRAMLIVDTHRFIITAFSSQVLSGLGHNPVTLRSW